MNLNALVLGSTFETRQVPMIVGGKHALTKRKYYLETWVLMGL